MSDPFLGQIIMFGGNFAPRSWAFCHGQLLPISQNTALFSILGTTYGGDGRTTFGLPDLRGRVPIAQGHGPGLSPHSLGSRGGNESTTLTEANLPAHNHDVTATAKCKSTAGNSNDAVGNVWADDAGRASATFSSAAPDADMNTNSIDAVSQNTGGSQPFNNMQPYLAVNYIIALQGTFPSRN
jgi:microcystin-dependent protein